MEKLELLQNAGQTVARNKHDHIFNQGDIDRNIYWLKSGLLKGYYITLDGKEFVKTFIQPGSFIASMTACYVGEACSFSLVCLQDSELVKVPFETLKEGADQDPEIAALLIDGLLQLSMKKEQREYEFLCLSAEERYRKFKQRYPELLEKITQNDMARYLGITPVALSRIKARVGKLTTRGPF